MSRNGDTTKTVCVRLLCFLQCESHRHAEETVGIATLHLFEIRILIAVYYFLHHDGCSYLSIVHVGKEHFGRIHAVDHEWWQHLHFLVHKDAPSVLQRTNHLPIHLCILLEPEVGMCVNNRRPTPSPPCEGGRNYLRLYIIIIVVHIH